MKRNQSIRRIFKFTYTINDSWFTINEIINNPFAKNFLLLLGLSAGMSVADASIQNKIYGPGTTVLIIPNKEMEDIMKIVKSLEESGLLIKGIIETIKNAGKEKKEDFCQCYQEHELLKRQQVHQQEEK